MHQATRTRVRRHLDTLRHDPALLFAGLLQPTLVAEALAREGVGWRDCVYTPMVTLWTFLSRSSAPTTPAAPPSPG